MRQYLGSVVLILQQAVVFFNKSYFIFLFVYFSLRLEDVEE